MSDRRDGNLFPDASPKEEATAGAGWMSRGTGKVRSVAFAQHDPAAPKPRAPSLLTEAPPPPSDTSAAGPRHELTPPPPPGSPATAAATAPRGSRPPSAHPHGYGSFIPPGPAIPSNPAAPSTMAGVPSMASAELALQLEAKMEAFAKATAELATLQARTIASVEGQLLELAVEIAGSILESEIEADHELHGALARAALSSLGDPTGATLRASREAYGALLDICGQPAIEFEGLHVQITLDPTLEGLGCVAENDGARVDGRISERLRSVRRALLDERRRRAMEQSE